MSKGQKNFAQRQFELHLKMVRESAKERKLPFEVLLASLSDAPENLVMVDVIEERAGLKRVSLINYYRPIYYESLIEEQAKLLTKHWPLIRLGKRPDEILAAIEKAEKLQAKQSRAGTNRAKQSQAQKQNKYSLIQSTEEKLSSTIKPRSVNKTIAKLLDFSPDYVRTARKEIADAKRKKAGHS